MKKPSTDLFDLIHVLTNSEKRNILLELQSNSNFVELFHALQSQTKFDESDLKRKYAKRPFVKNLATNKKHLYTKILKLLHQFSKNDVLEEIKNGTNYARILIKKGLLEASKKEVKKFKKLAYENQLYEPILDLLNVEKTLLTKKFGNGDMEVIFEEVETCLQKIKNTNDYWILLRRVHDFQMKFQKIRSSELDEKRLALENHPKLKDENLAETLESKVYFFQTNAVLLFIQGKAQEAFQVNQQLLHFFESEILLLQKYPEGYLRILYNYLVNSLESKNYSAFEVGLEKMSTISQQAAFQKVKNIEVRIFRQTYQLKISWWLGMKDYKKGILVIPELEAGLNRYAHKLEKHHLLTFYYLGAVLFFGNHQYDKALIWVNKILKDTRENIVMEIYQFSRLLNLLIHDALGNYTLLESLLPTTRRYLSAKRTLYKTEKLLFTYFKNKMNTSKKMEKLTLNQQLHQELLILQNEPSEKRVFHYIDLIQWVEGL